MKHLLLFTAVICILLGCTTVKTLQAIGGSRADAIVELAYQYGQFEIPQVQWEQGLVTATSRCRAWGFEKAEMFGGTTTNCQEYSSSGSCERWQVTVKYQCIGSI